MNNYNLKNLPVIALFMTLITLIFSQNILAENDDTKRLESDLILVANGNDHGHAKFEERSDRKLLKFEIKDQKTNSTFSIKVDGSLVGLITTNTSGLGKMELDSRQGNNIPQVKIGSKIEIISSGNVILSGTFRGQVAGTTPPTSDPINSTSVVISLGAKDKTVTEFYSPRSIQINQFDTVTWTNKDDTAHTVSGSSFDSGLLSTSQIFSHKFNENGTFEYVCRLHSWMTGQVIVGTGGSINSPSPVTATTHGSNTTVPGLSQNKVSIPIGSADKTVTEFYAPKSLTVKINEVVTWTNDDSVIHTVTSGVDTNNGMFDSGLLQASRSFSFTFTKNGVFDYFCQVHPWMTGQIIVESGENIQIQPTPAHTVLTNSSSTQNTLSNLPVTTKVIIPLGSAEKKVTEFYVPKDITIKTMDLIVWTNSDNAAHTVTSGSPDIGANGSFDSGLLLAGKSFEFQAPKVGIVNYYCIVHPWMIGTINIQENSKIQSLDQSLNDQNSNRSGILSDGTKILLSISKPTTGEKIQLFIEFVENVHANYDIKVIHNDMPVLDQIAVHANDGTNTHETKLLLSSDPVDVIITFQGFGIDDPKSGPIGERVLFSKIIPEFGTVTVMILVVAIISIILVSSKSKMFLKL